MGPSGAEGRGEDFVTGGGKREGSGEARAAPARSGPAHPILQWLDVSTSEVGRHSLHVLTEHEGSRSQVLGDLRELVRSHYVDPKIAAKRIASLGAPKTASLLREHIPMSKKARSGDLGEVLATELAELQLEYSVPIRRLRWKDGREMALRGDDIIGLARDGKDKLRLLKGESKSRATLSTAVLDEAGGALDSDRGRPTRHSVLFVAERLENPVRTKSQRSSRRR
jgi:hypothetical protein